jgi:hypothetical protein
MFLYARVVKFDASITFFLAMRNEPTTERAQMTEAIYRQAWDVPRLARRLEESSLADAETTSPKEMLPDARATERSFDRESPMKPPPHALPEFPANFKTTTPIN